MQFQSKSGVIGVNVADRATLQSRIRACFEAGEGFALATLNLDHLVKFDSDGAFADAYRSHEMVVADGNPIVWMSKLAADPVELLPGSDMVGALAQLAAESGVSVALVGSTQDSLEKAAEVLCARVKGLEIAVCIAPPFGFDPLGKAADGIFAQLVASGAGLCFLALGAPKQELFAARGRVLAPQVGFASIGAGLDFLAGSQKRAPEWVRRLALEWLWRMASQPKRMFMRYAHCFRILPGHMWRSFGQRFKR